MKPLFAAAAVALLVGASLFAKDFPKGSPDFASSMGTVKSAAKKSGKPMVVVFSASWCPPCQAMKKTVYPSAKVAALHDKFEWAYLDVDESSNSKVASEFNVNGIPHIEFLDKDGKSIGQQVGGVAPEEFAALLNTMLAKATPKS